MIGVPASCWLSYVWGLKIVMIFLKVWLGLECYTLHVNMHTGFSIIICSKYEVSDQCSYWKMEDSTATWVKLYALFPNSSDVSIPTRKYYACIMIAWYLMAHVWHYSLFSCIYYNLSFSGWNNCSLELTLISILAYLITVCPMFAHKITSSPCFNKTWNIKLNTP